MGKYFLSGVLVFIILLIGTIYADYVEQPRDQMSALYSITGPDVYDWQLAKLFNDHIQKSGYANAIFIFGGCYGGGMFGELAYYINQNKKDAVFLSAARYDEPSYCANITGEGYLLCLKRKMGFTGEYAQPFKEMARYAEKNDIHRAKGKAKRKGKEHPQYLALGNGDNIKIGYKANGEPVKSIHVIMFMGWENLPEFWHNFDETYKAFLYHDLIDHHNITVLTGEGKTNDINDPAYYRRDIIDGKGTLKALELAMKRIGKKMNEDEQFILWAEDHGTTAKTDSPKMPRIESPERQKVKPHSGTKKWELPTHLLESVREEGEDNQILFWLCPTYITESTAYENIQCWFNNKPLELTEPLKSIEEYDQFMQPSTLVAGQILISFKIPKNKIRKRNKIEIGWRNPDTFEPYTIWYIDISTATSKKVI